LNSTRESRKKLPVINISRSPLLTTAALTTFSSLLLCLLILVLNVEVGLPQGKPSELKQTDEDASRFRVERTAVAGGGELLTIWARVVGESGRSSLTGESSERTQIPTNEIPLLSVLRDTLGDANQENDVLREVWVHAYARPKLAQRAAALVPFFYKGLHVEPDLPLTSPPRAITNLSDTSRRVWRRLFVSGVINVLTNGPLLKTSVHSYRRNIADYRKSNLMRALTILTLYRSQSESDSPFSEAELVQMQSQLALMEKTFGGLVDQFHFPSFHRKETATLRDTRGHNWELLRQQAEASGLYFEPLYLSDKTVTHALLWFPVDALTSNDLKAEAPFQGRFLNIKNPWRDKRLLQWKGYTETRYFNLDNQRVTATDPTDPDNRAVTMIPLALYGLDFEKIPALLIDFRDSANPRRRELSGRLINDITRDVLSISKFGNVYYFLARSAFDFVTSRRGIDVNQPARLRSAAELRLLLSFNPNISDALREQLNKGLEGLSVNPLENNGKAERELAFAQYRSLQAYALRPDGLPARLERERRAEAAKFVHQGLDGKLMSLANVLTLGHYTHREKLTPELWQQINKERQLAYHTRFLRQVARSTALVEVSWRMNEVLPSLRYIAENGTEKDKEAAKAVGSIFSRTEDVEARALCLGAMKRIGNKTAQREMLRIYNDKTVQAEWRMLCAEYFQIASPQGSTAAKTDTSVGSSIDRSQMPMKP
jgi:hypothetical protein